jgi:hypothetical protein
MVLEDREDHVLRNARAAQRASASASRCNARIRASTQAAGAQAGWAVCGARESVLHGQNMKYAVWMFMMNSADSHAALPKFPISVSTSTPIKSSM